MRWIDPTKNRAGGEWRVMSTLPQPPPRSFTQQTTYGARHCPLQLNAINTFSPTLPWFRTGSETWVQTLISCVLEFHLIERMWPVLPRSSAVGVLVTHRMGIGWRTVEWNMKECVFTWLTGEWDCEFTWASFPSFPTAFWPNLLPAFLLPRCNSRVSSAPNACANIWVNFCRRDWDRRVCTLRTVIPTSQMLTLC